YSANIKMDWLDVIRQEYINHHTNAKPVEVPRREEFGEAVATENYTEALNGNCREGVTPISCLERVSGNYYASRTGGVNYTIGKPLEYAEEISSQYSSDIGVTTIPYISSAWRNPERNEAVGSRTSISYHQ